MFARTARPAAAARAARAALRQPARTTATAPGPPPTFFNGDQPPPAPTPPTPPSSPPTTPPPPTAAKPPSNFQTPAAEIEHHSKDNYFRNYKDLCVGVAVLCAGVSVLYTVLAQHEKIDELERQNRLLARKQAELAAQSARYKAKLGQLALESARNSVVAQGKMQLHIALLRQQLAQHSIEPVSVHDAVAQFESVVRVDTSNGRVELWIPGQLPIKALVPDPHEYHSRNK